MLRRFTLSWCAALTVAAALPATVAGKFEDWATTQGEHFRGEPAEVIGPLALFRTGNASSRLVPWHLLSAEACARFYAAVRTQAPRAGDWAHARGAVSEELAGHVQRVAGDRLAAADLKGRPEPEFFVLFFASSGEGKSWEMMGDAIPFYLQMQRQDPGLVEALFYGLRHSRLDHTNMAVGMKLPWLVTDYYDQDGLEVTSRFAPEDSYGLTVVNRNGVPLLSSPGDSAAAVKKVMGELADLLALLRPDNPLTWKDRAWYLRAVQSVACARGHSDPVLVGDPLRAEVLKKAGVLGFDAILAVAADGRVTAATVQPGGKLPPALTGLIAEALRQVVLVPAVTDGRPTDGVYHYHFPAAP
jgi:voltage-gated potassium channel Kch